jgi:hypothetical protein
METMAIPAGNGFGLRWSFERKAGEIKKMIFPRIASISYALKVSDNRGGVK